MQGLGLVAYLLAISPCLVAYLLAERGREGERERQICYLIYLLVLSPLLLTWPFLRLLPLPESCLKFGISGRRQCREGGWEGGRKGGRVRERRARARAQRHTPLWAFEGVER